MDSYCSVASAIVESFAFFAASTIAWYCSLLITPVSSIFWASRRTVEYCVSAAEIVSSLVACAFLIISLACSKEMCAALSFKFRIMVSYSICVSERFDTPKSSISAWIPVISVHSVSVSARFWIAASCIIALISASPAATASFACI